MNTTTIDACHSEWLKREADRLCADGSISSQAAKRMYLIADQPVPATPTVPPEASVAGELLQQAANRRRMEVYDYLVKSPYDRDADNEVLADAYLASLPAAPSEPERHGEDDGINILWGVVISLRGMDDRTPDDRIREREACATACRSVASMLDELPTDAIGWCPKCKGSGVSGMGMEDPDCCNYCDNGVITKALMDRLWNSHHGEAVWNHQVAGLTAERDALRQELSEAQNAVDNLSDQCLVEIREVDALRLQVEGLRGVLNGARMSMSHLRSGGQWASPDEKNYERVNKSLASSKPSPPSTPAEQPVITQEVDAKSETTKELFLPNGEWVFANYPGQLPHRVREAQTRAGYCNPAKDAANAEIMARIGSVTGLHPLPSTTLELPSAPPAVEPVDLSGAEVPLRDAAVGDIGITRDKTQSILRWVRPQYSAPLVWESHDGIQYRTGANGRICDRSDSGADIVRLIRRKPDGEVRA